MSQRAAVGQLLLGGGLVFFAGCSSSPQTVQDKQKSVQVTLPEGWETAVLPGLPNSYIQAKRPAINAYVAVTAQ